MLKTLNPMPKPQCSNRLDNLSNGLHYYLQCRLDIPKAGAEGSSAADVVLRPAADATVRPGTGDGAARDERVLTVETAAEQGQDTAVALLRYVHSYAEDSHGDVFTIVPSRCADSGDRRCAGAGHYSGAPEVSAQLSRAVDPVACHLGTRNWV